MNSFTQISLLMKFQLIDTRRVSSWDDAKTFSAHVPLTKCFRMFFVDSWVEKFVCTCKTSWLIHTVRKIEPRSELCTKILSAKKLGKLVNIFFVVYKTNCQLDKLVTPLKYRLENRERSTHEKHAIIFLHVLLFISTLQCAHIRNKTSTE